MHVNSFGGDRRMGMTWNACHTVQSDEEEWVLLVPRYDRSHFKIGLGQLRCPVKSFDAA